MIINIPYIYSTGFFIKYNKPKLRNNNGNKNTEKNKKNNNFQKSDNNRENNKKNKKKNKKNKIISIEIIKIKIYIFIIQTIIPE